MIAVETMGVNVRKGTQYKYESLSSCYSYGQMGHLAWIVLEVMPLINNKGTLKMYKSETNQGSKYLGDDHRLCLNFTQSRMKKLRRARM